MHSRSLTRRIIRRISLLLYQFYIFDNDVKIAPSCPFPSQFFRDLRSSTRAESAYLFGTMLIPPFTRHKPDSSAQPRDSFGRLDRASPPYTSSVPRLLSPLRFIAIAAVNRKRPPAVCPWRITVENSPQLRASFKPVVIIVLRAPRPTFCPDKQDRFATNRSRTNRFKPVSTRFSTVSDGDRELTRDESEMTRAQRSEIRGRR